MCREFAIRSKYEIYLTFICYTYKKYNENNQDRGDDASL